VAFGHNELTNYGPIFENESIHSKNIWIVDVCISIIYVPNMILCGSLWIIECLPNY
jgi:hypothetical protein